MNGKRLSDEQAFGFISQDGGEDAFIHHRGIVEQTLSR